MPRAIIFYGGTESAPALIDLVESDPIESDPIESDMTESELYHTIGEAGFRRLIAAFYRQVPSDDMLGPMYAGRNLADAEERLRDFLIFRFGGPARYIESRGHPRLRMRHMPFAVNQPARDRWVMLMDRALEEAALPAEAVVILQEFFGSTATFLVNRAG